MEWNELVIDYDRMSAETLLLAQNFQNENHAPVLDEPEKFETLPLEEECQIGPQIEGRGLLYYVDFQGQTYSIRGIAVHDLKESYAQALKGEQHILEPLRILQDSQIAEIKVFRTPTYATAEVLADQLFNRRFPIHEDSYFNVSDPGPGLWLVDRASPEFCLYFKRVFHQDLVTHSLGPIIDPKIATRRFLELSETLAVWPESLSMKIDEKALILQSHAQTELFQSCIGKLRDIFCHGQMSWTRDDFKKTTVGQTAYLFFLEVAYIRGFWIDIEGELERLSSTNR